MVDVRPFRALRPRPDLVEQVAAPPYDVVDRAEARRLAEGNPLSFLHVSRPEIDLPEEVDGHSDAAYAQGRTALEQLVGDGVLTADAAPTLSVYRQTMAGVVQTGIVACTTVADYDSGAIRTHEHTRPDKETDRVRHIDALDAHDEPVFLLSPPLPAVRAVLDTVTGERPADLDLTTQDRFDTGEAAPAVRHEVWTVTDADRIAAVVAAFAATEKLYVADGHHRSAAASRVHAERAARGATDGDSGAFLSVIFATDQVTVLPYQRVVTDLGGRSVTELLTALEPQFAIRPHEGPAAPEQPGSFGLYAAGQWYLLAARPSVVPVEDAVGSLDVAVLQDLVLGPLLGIADPRTDQRIAFVGGIRGTAELVRLVDAADAAAGGPGHAVAFALYPTSVAQLLAVADTGEVMPPKSTWFEPKLRSGLFLHPMH